MRRDRSDTHGEVLIDTASYYDKRLTEEGDEPAFRSAFDAMYRRLRGPIKRFRHPRGAPSKVDLIYSTWLLAHIFTSPQAVDRLRYIEVQLGLEDEDAPSLRVPVLSDLASSIRRGSFTAGHYMLAWMLCRDFVHMLGKITLKEAERKGSAKVRKLLGEKTFSNVAFPLVLKMEKVLGETANEPARHEQWVSLVETSILPPEKRGLVSDSAMWKLCMTPRTRKGSDPEAQRSLAARLRGEAYQHSANLGGQQVVQVRVSGALGKNWRKREKLDVLMEILRSKAPLVEQKILRARPPFQGLKWRALSLAMRHPNWTYREIATALKAYREFERIKPASRERAVYRFFTQCAKAVHKILGLRPPRTEQLLSEDDDTLRQSQPLTGRQ